MRLAISGGQNEPRDVIAGTVWALLQHPDQLKMIAKGQASYSDAFNEYTRWMSPIGMSPRQVARDERVLDYHFAKGKRVFFMFGIANRDPRVFVYPIALTFGVRPANPSRSAPVRVSVPGRPRRKH